MSGFDDNILMELGLRHELTAEEKARWRALVAAHPEMESEGEQELKLNELLRQLVDKPLASNFTAQVLSAIERESAPRPHAHWLSPWRFLASGRWMPKAAAVMLVVAISLVFYQEQAIARAELARSVAVMSTMTKLISVENLQDFEAISRFSQARVEVDEELLAALK